MSAARPPARSTAPLLGHAPPCKQHFEIEDVPGRGAPLIEQGSQPVVCERLFVVDTHVHARQSSVSQLNGDLDDVAGVRSSMARHLDREMEVVTRSRAAGNLPARYGIDGLLRLSKWTTESSRSPATHVR